MLDEPGLSATDVSRLSVCYDCFSAKHPFDVAPSHFKSTTGHRSVFGPFFFFAEWRELLVQGERDVTGEMLGNHGTLLKSVCC